MSELSERLVAEIEEANEDRINEIPGAAKRLSILRKQLKREKKRLSRMKKTPRFG